VSSSVDAVLQAAVDNGAVPGVVAMAATADGTIYEGSAGVRSAGESDPITADTMMRIASMTKMVTTTAALQLAEQGSLDIEAPVDTYRPEFADLQVLEGFDGDTPRLRPPATRATVRNLLTHTSGLAYWIWDRDIDRYEQVTGTPNICRAHWMRSPHRWCSIPARGWNTASTSTGWATSWRQSAGSRWTPTSPSTSPARWA
jgi:methyl acetate hydrolase